MDDGTDGSEGDMSDEHDFTRTTWGHNINPIGNRRMVGLSTPRPYDGDTVKWIDERGIVMKRLVNVEHCKGIYNMWFADYRDLYRAEDCNPIHDKSLGVWIKSLRFGEDF